MTLSVSVHALFFFFPFSSSSEEEKRVLFISAESFIFFLLRLFPPLFFMRRPGSLYTFSIWSLLTLGADCCIRRHGESNDVGFDSNSEEKLLLFSWLESRPGWLRRAWGNGPGFSQLFSPFLKPNLFTSYHDRKKNREREREDSKEAGSKRKVTSLPLCPLTPLSPVIFSLRRYRLLCRLTK